MTDMKNKLSRRDFLKISSVSGIVAATGGAKLLQTPKKEARPGSFSLTRRYYDSIEEMYEIDPNIERMDCKNTIFNRTGWDPLIGEGNGLFISFIAKQTHEVPTPQAGKPGWMPYDHALDVAAWAGDNTGAPNSEAGARGRGVLNNWERHANPERKRYEFDSPEDAARIVKRACRFLGADIVGIAPYDERWVYSKWYDITPVIEQTGEGIHEDAVFPFEPKSVIALAFEMDYDGLKAPAHINDAAVGLEYSAMAEVGHKVAVFLNELGYKSIPTGNDTALSIPIAVQAGLGELSRMGTMVTEEYGSRVRLAKVFTDLEIKPDRPKSFGVWEFCKRCKKCADACPSQAISFDDNPSVNPTVDSVSSHPGVKKWYQDNERCILQWERNSAACGVCLTACPYNKLDSWHHDLAEMLVSVPVGRDIARELDDFFGYGQMTPGNHEYFWNEEG